YRSLRAATANSARRLSGPAITGNAEYSRCPRRLSDQRHRAVIVWHEDCDHESHGEEAVPAPDLAFTRQEPFAESWFEGPAHYRWLAIIFGVVNQHMLDPIWI